MSIRQFSIKGIQGGGYQFKAGFVIIISLVVLIFN